MGGKAISVERKGVNRIKGMPGVGKKKAHRNSEKAKNTEKSHGPT